MKIILDIDNVVFDFSTAFGLYCNDLTLCNPYYWNFSQDGNASPELSLKLQEFIDSQPTLDLLDNSWSCITEEILSLGHQIIIVTGYPHLEQRIENLKLHNIQYSEIYTITNENKVEYVLSLIPDIIIEDNPHFIEQYTLSGIKMLFSPNCWNYIRDNHKCHYYTSPFEILKRID